MTAQEKMQRRNALRFRASMQKWFFMILVALILYRNVAYFSSVLDFFSMTFSDALLTPPGVTGIGASPPGKQNEPIGFQSQSDDGMWSPTWSLVCIVATCGIVYIHRKNRKQTWHPSWARGCTRIRNHFLPREDTQPRLCRLHPRVNTMVAASLVRYSCQSWRSQCLESTRSVDRSGLLSKEACRQSHRWSRNRDPSQRQEIQHLLRQRQSWKD